MSKSVSVVIISAAASESNSLGCVLDGFEPELGFAVCVMFDDFGVGSRELALAGATQTRLPIVIAEDGLIPRRGHIYLLPSDVPSRFWDGHIRLLPRKSSEALEVRTANFASSLSAELKHLAVGVTLGDDSARIDALRSIERNGGTVIVSDSRAIEPPTTFERRNQPTLLRVPKNNIGQVVNRVTSVAAQRVNDSPISVIPRRRYNDDPTAEKVALENAIGIESLLKSMPIPTMILGRDFRILAISPTMRRVLNANHHAVGEPLGSVTKELNMGTLTPILRDVLELLEQREIEVQISENRWFRLNVRPHRDLQDRITGLFVTLVDIDELTKGRGALLHERNLVQSVIDGIPTSVVVIDSTGKILTANNSFSVLANLRGNDYVGFSFVDLVRQLWRDHTMPDRLSMLQSSRDSGPFVWEATADEKKFKFHGYAVHSHGERLSVLLIEDVTRSKLDRQEMAVEKSLLETEVRLGRSRLQQTERELHRLASHLFSVQEDERQRVGRELHDDLGQRLSWITLKLDELQIHDESDTLKQVKEQLRALSTSIRVLSHQLHPVLLDNDGLIAALKTLVSDFEDSEKMPATFSSSGIVKLSSQPSTIAAYRITQEALRNVAKHAGKTHVKVFLMVNDDQSRLRLEIRDLGTGFDLDYVMKKNDGLGFVSMEERANMTGGTLTITSKIGEGTTVVADLPLTRL